MPCPYSTCMSILVYKKLNKFEIALNVAKRFDVYGCVFSNRFKVAGAQNLDWKFVRCFIPRKFAQSKPSKRLVNLYFSK